MARAPPGLGSFIHAGGDQGLATIRSGAPSIASMAALMKGIITRLSREMLNVASPTSPSCT
jgi:hypothetical protein